MPFSHTNIILIALILLSGLAIICYLCRRDTKERYSEFEEDTDTLESLKKEVKKLFHEITNQNIAELYLNKRETKKREQQKARLMKALRSCAQGNIGEKSYIKDYMKDLIQNQLGVNENTIDRILPFGRQDQLTAQDKFEILLYLQKKNYRFHAFEKLNELCQLDQPKYNSMGCYYEITEEDIEQAYNSYGEPLRYIDKLEILTQRIYQETYGFSVADELRDMVIDGISGGVSGLAKEQYDYLEEVLQEGRPTVTHTYDSLWIYFRGKAIHLSFLSFGSQSELVRVCKNLYRYDNVGHLTSSNGYKLTYLHDGSRVVVVRPKLASNWAFFLRKFDSVSCLEMTQLLRDDGNHIVIELLQWLVKGCLNLVLSGDQNSGKTTALKAMAQFIDQRYPIRTTEQEFELWLNNTYPQLNVACFRSSDEVDLIESIAIQKKTDGAIMILGEVVSSDLAAAFISLCQAGTKMTMCTCHCSSTDDLVDYFRNAVLASGTFHNEMIAEEQVANSIHVDIHWEKTKDGHRYISRISEIVPLPRRVAWPEDGDTCLIECLKSMARRRVFEVRDLIVCEEGRYQWKNPLSDRLIEKMKRNISFEEEEKLMAFHKTAYDCTN